MKRKALYPTLDVQRVNSSDIRRFCKSLKPQGSLSVEQHPQQKQHAQQQDQQHHQPAKQADEPGQQQLPDTTQDNIEVTQLSEQQQEQGPPCHQQQQQAPPSTSLHPTAAEAAAAAMDQQGGSPTQDAIELTPVGTDVVDQAARSRCVDRAVGSFVPAWSQHAAARTQLLATSSNCHQPNRSFNKMLRPLSKHCSPRVTDSQLTAATLPLTGFHRSYPSGSLAHHAATSSFFLAPPPPAGCH